MSGQSNKFPEVMTIGQLLSKITTRQAQLKAEWEAEWPLLGQAFYLNQKDPTRWAVESHTIEIRNRQDEYSRLTTLLDNITQEVERQP